MTRPVRLSVGRLAGHVPEHPDRTSMRDGVGPFGDIEVKQWPSRGAMLTACRMTDRGLGSRRIRPWLRADRDLFGL